MTEVGRLIYETSGGNLSAIDTYKQFLDLMRYCEEDTRELSKLCKMRGDYRAAHSWSVFANNFHQIQDVVTTLATGKGHMSVGYGNA